MYIRIAAICYPSVLTNGITNIILDNKTNTAMRSPVLRKLVRTHGGKPNSYKVRHLIMTYLCTKQQALHSDKNQLTISTGSNAIPQSDITTVEISFYDHEIYAGKKLIACITHDHDDFVTQRWVVMINDVEIHRANTWAKCYDYIIWHYKQGTLPTQQQEEIAATFNEETSQATPTSKFEFDLRHDVVKQNFVKLGEIGCTSGKHWVVRVHAQNQLTLRFDEVFNVVGSLWLVEISPLETNQSINISESCEELNEQPFDELISEEWDR